MKLSRSGLFAAAIAFLVAGLDACAQVLEARPISATGGAERGGSGGGATAMWPAVLPSVSTRTVDATWDGMLVKRLRLKSGDATLEADVSRLSDWLPVAEPVRYAIEWTYRWSGAVRMGIALPPPRFMPPSLDDTNWDAYLRSIRQQHGPQLQFVCNDDSNKNPQMLRPLGGRTRVLEYEVKSDKLEEPPMRIIQVFASTGQMLVVFGFEGESAMIAKARPLVGPMLFAFQPVSE